MAETSLIKKRRRLSALYDKGVEVRIGGRYGEGVIARLESTEQPEDTPEHLLSAKGVFTNPLDESDDSAEVSMWIQPPSPLNREEALRLANAARARTLLLAREDKDSQEYLEAQEFITTMSEQTLFDYVLLSEADDRRQDALREVLADDEWADLTELQESLRVFEEEEYADDHPEVVAVRQREIKLNEQVAQREKELAEAALEALKLGGVQRAQRQARERRSEIAASQSFMQEYQRQMNYFAVRESPEHARTFFFESPRDLADQPEELRELITRALGLFIADGADAKN